MDALYRCPLELCVTSLTQTLHSRNATTTIVFDTQGRIFCAKLPDSEVFCCSHDFVVWLSGVRSFVPDLLAPVDQLGNWFPEKEEVRLAAAVLEPRWAALPPIPPVDRAVAHERKRVAIRAAATRRFQVAHRAAMVVRAVQRDRYREERWYGYKNGRGTDVHCNGARRTPPHIL